MCYIVFSCGIQGLRNSESSVQRLDRSFWICRLCLFCFVLSIRLLNQIGSRELAVEISVHSEEGPGFT